MSLLMFQINPDQGFWVVTDTLATGEGFRPGLYQSKAVSIPHLDLVIAGTGLAQFNARWWAKVMDQILCIDIEMLDTHAPGMLRELWKQLEEEFGPAPGTATIYHLGRSAQTGKYLSYAYRSTDGFESEPLEPGFRIKPDPPEGWEQPDDLAGVISLAHSTRQKEDRRPPEQRIHIGGDLILIDANDNGTSSKRIHRWDDHYDMWLEMNALLIDQKERGTPDA
jgi:hypothetical protein